MTATATDRLIDDDRTTSVGVVAPSKSTQRPANVDPTPSVASPALGAFDELRVYSECFWDALEHRKAIVNRLRSGTVPPDVTTDVLTSIVHTESMLKRAMLKSFRRAAPEVAAWTKATPGLGEHTMARLLGIIGHPVIAQPHHWEGIGSDRVLVADPPFERNVAKLWAYCGHGDPTRRKVKGMTADDAFALGSPRAKTIVYLIAVGCMKQIGNDVAGASANPKEVARRRSPYRDTYDIRRSITADRAWTDGHAMADALRITGKEILRDLWIVARNTMPETS